MRRFVSAGPVISKPAYSDVAQVPEQEVWTEMHVDGWEGRGGEGSIHA